MKLFQMNKNDYVLHTSFDEAVKFYKEITGAFGEYKDEHTGKEFEIEKFKINLAEPFEKEQLMTVKEAIRKGKTELPAIYFY